MAGKYKYYNTLKILRRDRWTCQDCSNNLPIPMLQVHHIDKNKQNSKDENLITLCGFCHKRRHFSPKSKHYIGL